MARLDQIEKLSRWPLFLLAGLFLPVIWIEYGGSYSAGIRQGAEIVEYVIHAAFALEFLARVLSVGDKAGYVRRNWYDLGTVVLPPLRLLRGWRERLIAKSEG